MIWVFSVAHPNGTATVVNMPNLDGGWKTNIHRHTKDLDSKGFLVLGAQVLDDANLPLVSYTHTFRSYGYYVESNSGNDEVVTID